MLIKNGYAEKAKKEQPKKDEDGYMLFTPSAVSFDAQGKFGSPQLVVDGHLEGTEGGSISERFFFDFVMMRNKSGNWTRLPLVLQKLGLFTDEELEQFASKESFTKEDVREIATPLRETVFKFRKLKDSKTNKFRVDYNSICDPDVEVGSFTI